MYLWGNLPVLLATQRKSPRKFNLPLIATTCESVWPRLYNEICTAAFYLLFSPRPLPPFPHSFSSPGIVLSSTTLMVNFNHGKNELYNICIALQCCFLLDGRNMR